MESRNGQPGVLQTTCTVESISPTMMRTRAQGPGGEAVEIVAEAELDLLEDTTRICYTLANASGGTGNVLRFTVPICLTSPCNAIQLPAFSEGAQPAGCCPSPDDALTFESDAGACRAVVTFDPEVLPGECLQFCLTYSGIHPPVTQVFDLSMSSGAVLSCATLTVDCPPVQPTTTTTTTSSTTSTSSTTTTPPPPRGVNWPGGVFEVEVVPGVGTC